MLERWFITNTTVVGPDLREPPNRRTRSARGRGSARSSADPVADAEVEVGVERRDDLARVALTLCSAAARLRPFPARTSRARPAPCGRRAALWHGAWRLRALEGRIRMRRRSPARRSPGSRDASPGQRSAERHHVLVESLSDPQGAGRRREVRAEKGLSWPPRCTEWSATRARSSRRSTLPLLPHRLLDRRWIARSLYACGSGTSIRRASRRSGPTRPWWFVMNHRST